MRSVVPACCLLLALSPPPQAAPPGTGEPTLLFSSGLSYKVRAGAPRLNRLVGEDVVRSIRGVAAEPVDSFVWNGVGSVPISGTLSLRVDPVEDVGRIEASWQDDNGTWSYRQTVFAPPAGPAGVRIGKSVQQKRMMEDEGIVHNVFLFGDTGAGEPVLPTLFAYVAAWGPAEVLLDGEPFREVLGGQESWSGRVIVSEGARDPNGIVLTERGGIFDTSQAAAGFVDGGDLEVQLMFHGRPSPTEDNVPEEYGFFYNVVFEDVTVELLHFGRPGSLAPSTGGSLPAAAGTAADTVDAARYEVVARSPRRNRRVMGPPILSVHGVPAEPVDSFVWNGVGSDPVDGELILEVFPDLELGAIQATWTDEHGDWVYLQTRFIHPEHSSGVRLGPSAAGEVLSLLNEGITNNVYLHGDTTAGMPILPTVFNLIATWGPADVFLNGQPFPNPFELPAPQWIGHLMITEGVRLPDGTVRTEGGEIYNPSRLTEGAVQTDDLEVHLVFHDERGFPPNGNIPPLFSFFYHLVFEEVSLKIVQQDR